MNLEFLLLALVFLMIVLPCVLDFGTARSRITSSFVLLHVVSMMSFVWLRRVADDAGRPVLVDALSGVERLLFFGHIPSVWLQDRLFWVSSLQWFDYLAGLTYPAHFFVIWMVGALLWRTDHKNFVRYSIASSIQYVVSLPVIFLFPAAPPWYASEIGAIGRIDRIFAIVGASISDSAVKRGLDTSGNDLAALPSIHMSVATLVCLSVWAAGGRLRWMGGLYAILTLWAIVYGGEHYVVDAMLGVALALVSWKAATPRELWHVPTA